MIYVQLKQSSWPDLIPAIHVFLSGCPKQGVDARHEAGHGSFKGAH
jgi:hypothetical protein